MKEMSTKTMHEVNVNMKSKNIARVRIVRDGLGVSIYYRSKMFHEMFSAYAQRFSRYSRWGRLDIKGYDISSFTADPLFTDRTASDMMETSQDDYCRVNMKEACRNWGNDTLLFYPNFVSMQGIPNISWLGAENADKGVVIEFQKPMSNRAFELYVKQVGRFMKFIYEQFLRPDKREVKLSLTYETGNDKSRLKGSLVKERQEEVIEEEVQ